MTTRACQFKFMHRHLSLATSTNTSTPPVSHRFSTVPEAVDAIARGEVIIVVDAEDRENEGDFICAATKATAETVNFMITHGRGQLCMPILPDVSQRLNLHPMVETNTAPLGTNYTVPV